MSPKLAICLQVCPTDAFLGHRLVKLICAIEPSRRADIEFILSARRGTNPVTVAAIAETAKARFANVRVINAKRFGTGWPQGCNDLWAETMLRVSQMYDAKQITADGVLTFESDCLPLRHDWLDRLAEAWAVAKATGKLVCGHAHGWMRQGVTSIGDELPEEHFELTHINGNAIFHVALTDKYGQLNGSDSQQGWDCYHGKLLLAIGLDTPMIFQKYRIKQTTREEVEGIRKFGHIPALFHGIKKETGLAAVESMIADASFFHRV